MKNRKLRSALFVKTAALCLLSASVYATTAQTSGGQQMTPAEQAKIRKELVVPSNQHSDPMASGFLLQCKGPDGKLFTTRVLGSDCIVHEEISPLAVISDTPRGDWRKVQSNASADYYFDDASYTYVDAQAAPKRGPEGGAETWVKIVWHQPKADIHGKAMYTTMLMSLTYSCRSNLMTSNNITWLYDTNGQVVGAYPPMPELRLKPDDPLAPALQTYCKTN